MVLFRVLPIFNIEIVKIITKHLFHVIYVNEVRFEFHGIAGLYKLRPK